MCGIFGYKGQKYDAKEILLTGLKRLEYRGYDSAWMALMDKKDVEVIKAVGKVSNLAKKLQELNLNKKFSQGMAHTRWATHWGVTLQNTHPHYSSKKEFFVVHNWIIENYAELKKELEQKGYTFYSQTDTEVVAKLLEDNKKDSLLATVEAVLPRLEWAYAFLIFSTLWPDEFVAVRYGSPLVLGFTKDKELFFSSDLQALAWFADEVIFLDDGDVVGVKGYDFVIKSEWELVTKPIQKVDVDALKAEKWPYPHYMLKEIFEQGEVLKNVFRWRINFETNELVADAFRQLDSLDIKKVVFVASGTSYHAGEVAARWLQDLAWVEASAQIGSEFVYRRINVDPQTLFVFISQSGETADSIEALKLVKAKWWKTFGIVNVVGSTIARLTDMGMFTRAWTEIWVASTKAFIAQLGVLILLTLYFARKNGLSLIELESIIKNLAAIPTKIEEILYKQEQNIQQIAKDFSKFDHAFFLGRHFNYPVAMEGSLKFKEISYIHSEAYPAWELKHWPLALIDEKFPSVLIMPKDLRFDHNLSTLQEIKARNGKVLGVSDQKIKWVDWQIDLPSTHPVLYPFLATVALQLLAYRTARELGREIDKPRNLAKSVTVK